MNLHDIQVSITVDKKNYVAQLKDVSKTTEQTAKQVENTTKQIGVKVQDNLDKLNMRKAYQSANLFFRMFIGGTMIYGVQRAFRSIISSATEGDAKFEYKMKNMTESWKQFEVNTGKAFVPAIEQVLDTVNQIIGSINGFNDKYKDAPKRPQLSTDIKQGLAYKAYSWLFKPDTPAAWPSNIDLNLPSGGRPIRNNAYYEAEMMSQAGNYRQSGNRGTLKNPNYNWTQFLQMSTLDQPIPRQISNSSPWVPGRGAGENGARFSAGRTAPEIDKQLVATEERFRQFNANLESSWSNDFYGIMVGDIKGIPDIFDSVTKSMSRSVARFFADWAAQWARAQMQSGLSNILGGKLGMAMANASPGSPTGTYYTTGQGGNIFENAWRGGDVAPLTIK